MSFLTLKSWKAFESIVGDCAHAALRCLSVYNGFLQLKGKSLKSALTDEVALKCILGGFQGDGYAENSLYNFCNQLLGLSIDVEKLTSLLKQTDLQESSQFIEIQVKESEFVRKLKEFFSAAQQIGFNYQPFTTLVDPRNYVEELVNKLLRLSPNYSEYTLFLVRTFRIAKIYLDQLFPESEHPERGSVLEYLGFKKILDPGGPENVRRAYAIYGYPRDSLGWKLLKIMNIALDILSLPEVRKYFPGLEDEREKFLGKVRDLVHRPKIPIVDSIDKEIQHTREKMSQSYIAESTRKNYGYQLKRLLWEDNPIETPHRAHPHRYYSDEGFNLRSCSFEAAVEDGIVRWGNITLDFPSLVDAVAPHMSVGLAFVDVTEGGRVRWWFAWPR